MICLLPVFYLPMNSLFLVHPWDCKLLILGSDSTVVILPQSGTGVYYFTTYSSYII